MSQETVMFLPTLQLLATEQLGRRHGLARSSLTELTMNFRPSSVSVFGPAISTYG